MSIQTKRANRRRRLLLPQFLLRDEFMDARAAGAVNGTHATDGYSTRTVADTDSKLTIGSGKLNLAPHSTPAWGDPGLWHPVVTRVAGRGLLMRLACTQSNDDAMWGWDTSQSAFISKHAFRHSGTALSYGDGSQYRVIAAVVSGTEYAYFMGLRANGIAVLIKGGVFDTWTLLWMAADNAGNAHPGVRNKSANLVAADYVRIPKALWLPRPLASDSFNRGDGALGTTDGAGHAETTGPGSGGRGRVWTADEGTWVISGNKAVCTARAAGVGVATVDVGNVDHIVTLKATRAGNNVGGVLRYVDAQNQIRYYHDGVNANLDKVVGGVVTSVIQAAAAYGAGKELRVIPDGTTFALYYDDARVGVTSTINDAVLQTGTKCGLLTTNIGNSLDDFLAYKRKGYDILDVLSGKSKLLETKP